MNKILALSLSAIIVLFVLGCQSRSQAPNAPEPLNGQPESQLPVSTLTQEAIATKLFVATEADVKAKLLGKVKFAVFFTAEECPTCAEIEAEITENLETLPQDLIIAKLSYESEIQFRREYAVNYPSSVLTFDANGELIELLISPDLQQILLSLNPDEAPTATNATRIVPTKDQ